ncbi:MAG: polymerase [Solirubrobacteraceae bacterium]|nr:polymerase [Solirubrobacteraceae bacterium]
MPDPTNAQIALALDELGDLYELDGAIIHRVVAYRNAARAIREASMSVAALAREGRATELPGVGKTLQEKIQTLTETGEIPSAVKLRAKFPAGLLAVTRLPGLGPKRARLLYDELGIDSLDALRAAAEGERLRGVKGFGAKAEESILAGIAAAEAGAGAEERVVLSRALAVAEPLVAALRDHPAAERVELAGSARRWTDSVKDIDLIATAHDPEALARGAAELPTIASASGVASAGARLTTYTGMKVDLRIVAPEQFGNLLQHFTGSKAHNEALRRAAVRRGLHVSEYGILDDADGETLKCAGEAEVYARLGMQYIEPELRENRGELEAAAQGTLPELVEVGDVRGELHSHTVASDGKNTLEEMVAAAQARGLKYLAVTDHSASMGFGADVSPSQLERQIERVRELDAQLKGFDLLIGSEVNILPDGGLDYDDDLLSRLDWVIASVHTSFRMPQDEQTARIVAACEHPWVDCIGHLTGRKIERRPPYALDVEAVIDAAARTGTMLEINSSPDRRDLIDVHARAAAAAGVPIVINTDAHKPSDFDYVRYGVATARRGWLTKADVANTRTWKQLAKLRKRAKAAR